MKNIISVPTSLFDLENFLLCDFDALTDDDIKKIKCLFSNPELIATYNMDDLRSLQENGLSNDIINTEDKIKETGRVLKLLN